MKVLGKTRLEGTKKPVKSNKLLKFALAGVLTTGLLLISKCNNTSYAPIKMITKTDVMKEMVRRNMERPFYDITLVFDQGNPKIETRDSIFFVKNISRKKLKKRMEDIIGTYGKFLISFGNGIPHKKQMEIFEIAKEILEDNERGRVGLISDINID